MLSNRINLLLLLLGFGVSLCLSRSLISKREGEMESDQNFPLTCEVRQYNFSVELTDKNDRKCKAAITAMACYGSCDTYEYGQPEFPNRKSNRVVCIHDETKQKTVNLDCDEGADQTIRTYTFPEAVTCACKVCDSTMANCRDRSKRGTTIKPISEGQFASREYQGDQPVDRSFSTSTRRAWKNVLRSFLDNFTFGE